MASPTDRSVTPLSPSPATMSDESKGSSVSTILREEYEDLLRYAVVTPHVDSKVVKHTQSPEKKGNLASPKRESRVENVVRTDQRHPNTSQKPEVKFVDFPGSSSDSSSSSTVQNEDLADGSCSSFLSEQTKHIVPHPRAPAQFGHSMNTCNELTAPTATGPAHHHHHHHHHLRPPVASSSLSEPEKKHHCHHHHVCVQGSEDSDSADVQPLMVDPEIGRLGREMDACWLELKKRVTAEFEQSRIRVIESQQAQLQQEREQRMIELNLLREEVCRNKEMALTYEQSLTSKDLIIENLTIGLHKAKDRMHKQHMFSMWHLRHIDEKRERFCCAIAGKHHRRKMLGHVLAAWSSLIKHSWKLRTEKACQIKAEEVCLELTRQYEEQVENMKVTLEETEQKCAQFRGERDEFEANVKKAFMRGVCALNLEAMTVLKTVDQDKHPTLHQVEAQAPLGHTHKATETYKRTQATTHLPTLNVEGRGLAVGNGASQCYPHETWSKLSKWAESLGPPEPKGYSEKLGGGREGSRPSETVCGGRMPLGGRPSGSGRVPGASRSSKPSPGMCTIKGTVKGYLRPTVVIEKHAD